MFYSVRLSGEITLILDKIRSFLEVKASKSQVQEAYNPLTIFYLETKWKYDVAPEEKQVVWKQMILNFMER